jgi:RNA polymerase sigma factor for flagellar operon FliA
MGQILKVEQTLKIERPNRDERRRAPRSGPSFGSRHGKKFAMGLTKAELIEKYRFQVRMIAIKVARQLPASFDVDDLISIGFIGLLDAAERFDASKNVKFETFSEFRIRGAMLDELRKQDWLPRSARDRLSDIAAAKEEVENRTGAPATLYEVCGKLKITVKKFQELMRDIGAPALVNIEDMPEGFELQTSEKADPFRLAAQGEAKVLVGRLLSDLPEHEQSVLRFHYYRGLNLKEISVILGVSESRICQLRGQALATLRKRVKKDSTPIENVLLALIDE